MATIFGPYLRGDLTEGANTRRLIDQIGTRHARSAPVNRLLETVDHLYEVIDKKDAIIERERLALASETTAHAETGQALAKLRHQIMDKSREIQGLKRTSFQHAGLPEDVQALREEAAAWKDQYATLKNINENLRTEVRTRSTELAAHLKGRRKWRKRARLAEAIVTRQIAELCAADKRHTQDVVDLKTSNEALQKQLCVEAKDHEHTIRIAAECFKAWVDTQWNANIRTAYLVSDWLGSGGVKQVAEAKREAGL